MTPAPKAAKRVKNLVPNDRRCDHRFANHGRCRLFVPNAHSRFCVTHARLHRATPDLAVMLTANLEEFKSAEPINDFLSRLLLALAHDRISPRRAAVLAYITNQLLRTVAAIDRETDRENEAHAEAAAAPVIIWDSPRPVRRDVNGDAESQNADPVSADPTEELSVCAGAAADRMTHSAHQTDASPANLPSAHAPCTPGRVVYRNSPTLPGAGRQGTNDILRHS